MLSRMLSSRQQNYGIGWRRLAASGAFLFMAANFIFVGTTRAEMQRMDEGELSRVAGQSGISIEIPHLRINAHPSGSVDDSVTAADESDGRRSRGFKLDYTTTDHLGQDEAHLFVDEVSLALDITGAITIDIEQDGALVVGLPERMNYVGDGLSFKGVYLNSTGTPDMGGKLMNEINIQGNFSTGGTMRMWSD